MEKGLEIGDGEAEMMASREMGGIGDGWRGSPWTFGEVVGWVALYEVEIEGRGGKAQPHNLEISEFGALHFLEPKHLRGIYGIGMLLIIQRQHRPHAFIYNLWFWSD